MNKNSKTLYTILGLIFGLFGGIAGTAFSFGADRQNMKDSIRTNQSHIALIRSNIKEQNTTQKIQVDEMTTQISFQINLLRNDLKDLSDKVSTLSSDVNLLQALMERVESDIRNNNNKN